MFVIARRPLRVSILAFGFFTAFGAASASYAQTTIDPDQAKAFVKAALAVINVNEDWKQRIFSAKSEVEAQRLRDQASLAMRKAIKETEGISIDGYRSIYYAAKHDAELADYLSDLLKQETSLEVR